jgi:hypothetical protein
MGYDADQAILKEAAVDVDVLDSGCCGLAGNFGFEAGHYDVSLACAERVLLPAVRDATADSFVLADGFSCRTQIEQAGTGRTPVHLAEILASGLRHTGRNGGAQDGLPLQADRPAPPGTADYARLAGLGAAAAGASAAATALLTRWVAAQRRRR